MFKSNQPYINLNEDVIVSKSTPVVLFNTKREDFRVRRFISAALLAVSLGVVSIQAGFVLNANATENPVSSPEEESQSQQPSSSENSSNTPVTSPEVGSSRSEKPSDEPVTSPEVSPSPSPSTSPSNGGSNRGNNGNNGGNNNSSNSGGSVGAPSCNNEAPKSAPKIISAVTTGKNEITLTWEKAKNPVTHYVLAYGLSKGKPLYGNPNVGNVSSYTVKGLSGGATYFFKVRAGNDCQTGPYSEEIGVKVGGKFINSPAQGFKAGVLGKTTNVKSSNKPAYAKPVVFNQTENLNQNNAGLAGKVFNFFASLLKP